MVKQLSEKQVEYAAARILLATRRTRYLEHLPTLLIELQMRIIEQLEEQLPALLDSRITSTLLQRASLTWPHDSTLRGKVVAALRNGGQGALRRRLARGPPQMWVQFAAHHASHEELDMVLGIALKYEEDMQHARDVLRGHPHLLTSDVLLAALASNHQQVQLVLDVLDFLHPGLGGVDLLGLVRNAARLRSTQLVFRLVLVEGAGVGGAAWNADVLQQICEDGNLLWLLDVVAGDLPPTIHAFLGHNNWITVCRLMKACVWHCHVDTLNRLLHLARSWGYLQGGPARVLVLDYIRRSPNAKFLFRDLHLSVWLDHELEKAWRRLNERNTVASRDAAQELFQRAVEYVDTSMWRR